MMPPVPDISTEAAPPPTEKQGFFTPPFSKKKKLAFGIVGIFFLLLFAGMNIAVYQYGRHTGIRERQAKTLPTPTPSPYPINRHGKMTFTVQSKKPGISFVQGYIDPFDVQTGKNQTLGLYVSNDIPIASMAAVWKTDSKTKLVPMTQKEGKKTEGWWEGVWPADDTLLYTFTISVFAYDARGESQLEIPFRDNK